MNHSIGMTLLELLEKQHCIYACMTLTDESRIDESSKGNMTIIKDWLVNYKWSTVVGTANPRSLNYKIDLVLDYVWKLGDVARSQQSQDQERMSLFPWL